MSKALELAAIFDDELKWQTTPISRTEVATELRRQHSRIAELEATIQTLNKALAMTSEGNKKLEAALDVAQKDAARYRWVRDHDDMNEAEGLIYRAQGNKAQIDAEIDERIKEVRK